MSDWTDMVTRRSASFKHPLGRAFVFAIVATTVAFVALVAPQARGAVYWGNNGFIGAVNLDGSGADFGYFNPTYAAGTPNGAYCDVAVSSRYLYWLGSITLLAGGKQISRVNLDGPTVAGPVVSGLSGACSLSASESHLYWTDAETQTITRASLDGTNANAAFIEGVARPCGLTVDERHIYWAWERGIGRANLQGGEVEPSFISGFMFCGVAVTDHYIFWSDHSLSISRANIDGTEVNSHFINGTATVGSIAADTAHLYWTNWYQGGKIFSTIGHSNLDGTDVNQSWVTTNRRDPLSGIAVDSRLSLSPLPLPSRQIRFRKLRHNRRTGVVLLDVWAWKGGELTVTAPKIGWKVINIAVAQPASSLRERLKLWPGRTGLAANHIHRQLKNKGRSPISLRIRYREAGKTPITKHKRLAFVRHRRKRQKRRIHRRQHHHATGPSAERRK